MGSWGRCEVAGSSCRWYSLIRHVPPPPTTYFIVQHEIGVYHFGPFPQLYSCSETFLILSRIEDTDRIVGAQIGEIYLQFLAG